MESQISQDERYLTHDECDCLSKAEFKRLPRRRVAQSRAKCMICLEEFQRGQVIRVLPCHHKFHDKCMRPWFKKSIHCPLCRFDVKHHLNPRPAPCEAKSTDSAAPNPLLDVSFLQPSYLTPGRRRLRDSRSRDRRDEATDMVLAELEEELEAVEEEIEAETGEVLIQFGMDRGAERQDEDVASEDELPDEGFDRIDEYFQKNVFKNELNSEMSGEDCWSGQEASQKATTRDTKLDSNSENKRCLQDASENNIDCKIDFLEQKPRIELKKLKLENVDPKCTPKIGETDDIGPDQHTPTTTLSVTSGGYEHPDPKPILAGSDQGILKSRTSPKPAPYARTLRRRHVHRFALRMQTGPRPKGPAGHQRPLRQATEEGGFGDEPE